MGGLKENDLLPLLVLTVKKLGKDIWEFRQGEGGVVPVKVLNETESIRRLKQKKRQRRKENTVDCT
jgi:hypothetical protein